MTIPKTRAELTNYIHTSFGKLWGELEAVGPDIADAHCVDEWSVKDLLTVRVWWTESVADWVEAGVRGEIPVTPAEGYSWRETPRLNQDVVLKNRPESFGSVCARLERGYQRVLSVIASLDDRSLLEVGIFPWAGNYPISRWISINTARQYTTARTFIRRAIRNLHH